MIKRKLFIYIIFILILSIIGSIYTLLIYYGKTSSEIKAFNKITFVIGVFCFFILGLLAGNTAGKNGLLEGLTAGLIIILLTLIINFFIHVPFVTNTFIKIISFLSAASLGGVIGVNFQPVVTNE